jgi:hypothetical protein
MKLQERHIGLLVVGLALIVTAPRLAHAFIMGDGLALDTRVEFWTLVVTGVASGLVLTVGNAFLAHVLARHFDRRSPLAWLLALAWVVYLLFAVALIAPALMVGMQRSPLVTVMPYTLLQWAWCVLAALSIEVLVAGSMAAYAIAARVTHEPPLTGVRGASVPPAAVIPAPIVSIAPPVTLPTPEPIYAAPIDTQPAEVVTEQETTIELDDTSNRLLSAIRANRDGISKREASRLADVNPETGRRKIDSLASAGLVSVNGKVRAL